MNSPPNSQPPDAAKSSKPKKRSTAERVVVQGGIAVLLVIMAIEGWAYYQMSRIHAQLSAELKRSEATDYRLTQSKVKAIFAGRQPDSSKTIKAAIGEERFDVYHFQGLLKSRELCVHYGVNGMNSEPEVTEIMTVLPDEMLIN